MDLDEMLAVMAASILGGMLARYDALPEPGMMIVLRKTAIDEASLLWQDVIIRKPCEGAST